MNALSEKRIVPPKSPPIGYEKGLLWTATVRSDPSPKRQTVVEGDTAFYAWKSAAKVFGVSPNLIDVIRCEDSASRAKVEEVAKDPWYWLPTVKEKAASKRKTKANRKRSKRRKT
jgi:hypothetical protein